MKPFDLVVVGSGLFGAVFAHEANKAGKRVLVVERRPHHGGNVYCENVGGINVHVYGAHIFHTNDRAIWEYVNSFVTFNRYTNSPLAVYKGNIYNLPFNMNTFYQLWKVKTPAEALAKLEEQRSLFRDREPANLEEQALSLVGRYIYEILIKGYTEKQWGRKATDLPAFIIKRLPFRLNFDNNYFDDKFQGIPIGGYNKLVDGLLEGIEKRTGVDFFKDRYELEGLAEKIVFTGMLDEFYDFRFGRLEYRSLRFEQEHLPVANFQGNAVVNYTDKAVPFTRIIEHKHFEFGKQDTTVITREFPQEYSPGQEPFYPIADEWNSTLFKKYRSLAEAEADVIFGGRLASYRYYDMHQVVGAALVECRKYLESGKS
jgi:UDP-galactopyranose mutase